MSTNIIAVYQDCFLCGSTSAKDQKMLAEIAKKGAEFRKLSFATSEGQQLCAKAIEKGVCHFPFFTDGVNFSQNYEDILNAKPVKEVKIEAKTIKAKKGKK